MKLCLVVTISDGPFIDDVFIDKVKSGYLVKGFQVRKDSFDFKPQGRYQRSICHLFDQ